MYELKTPVLLYYSLFEHLGKTCANTDFQFARRAFVCADTYAVFFCMWPPERQRVEVASLGLQRLLSVHVPYLRLRYSCTDLPLHT